MANIIQNHLLRCSIAASSSVPWIYLGKLWHTLQEGGSKYRIKFVLDRKEITLTLNDFRRILYLPQATDNNHERFVAAQRHYMTAFQEISHRAHDKYHNFEDDVMVKNIFNSGKHKDGVGMKIPSWMITNEIKLTDHYQMYAALFGVDVPTTQSQPIESTQGTHRIISATISPNPDTNEGESSALRREIEKLVEGAKNVENVKDDSSTFRQDDTQIVLGTRLETRSDKESPEVEITVIEQPVNDIEEEEESAEDDYELRRREKGKRIEKSRSTPSPTTIRSPRTHSTLIYSDTKKL
ncbi:hypothetical protein Tco_1368048 [Tanacetum coccineum]